MYCDEVIEPFSIYAIRGLCNGKLILILLLSICLPIFLNTGFVFLLLPAPDKKFCRGVYFNTKTSFQSGSNCVEADLCVSEFWIIFPPEVKTVALSNNLCSEFFILPLHVELLQ